MRSIGQKTDHLLTEHFISATLQFPMYRTMRIWCSFCIQCGLHHREGISKFWDFGTFIRRLKERDREIEWRKEGRREEEGDLYSIMPYCKQILSREGAGSHYPGNKQNSLKERGEKRHLWVLLPFECKHTTFGDMSFNLSGAMHYLLISKIYLPLSLLLPTLSVLSSESPDCEETWKYSQRIVFLIKTGCKED